MDRHANVLRRDLINKTGKQEVKRDYRIWTSQALTHTFEGALEHGRTYEQSAQLAAYPS
jgi:hypothetical protein